MQSQLNDITQRLARIETNLDDHTKRIITRLEERTSPLRRWFCVARQQSGRPGTAARA